MRPLLVPLKAAEAFEYERPGQDVVPLLLDRLGSYCSICERPLLEQAFAWDSETGTTVSALSPLALSTRLLVLCRTCEAVQAPRDDSTGRLMLPFEGPTFTLGTDRLFDYNWQGAIVGPPETLDYFALERPAEVDTRTRLRVEAWRGANHAARRLAEDDFGLERRLLPHLIVATGFLSMWASTLLEAFGSADRVREFFGSARDEIAGFFPGTDWSRMVQRPMER
jgi:hypothetical protein